MNDGRVPQEFAALLDRARCPSERNLERLAGGGNNRVYRVQADGFDAVLKAYFHHPDDPRNRLRSEFSFSSLAWDVGVRCIARPLEADHERHLGLYEFLPGRRATLEEIDAAAVRQAVQFVVKLNQNAQHAPTASLPVAAEACFTVEDHCRCVSRRVDRLSRLDLRSSIGSEAELDHEAGRLVADVLAPLWEELLRRTRRETTALGLEWSQEVPVRDWCLSPSDFGFHNALVRNGDFYFIDFEYAGWDDPAKLACDFFCQPALPVDPRHYGEFVAAVTARLSDPAGHAARIGLLLPVYQLKWCCIVLNEFLPVDGRRRQFAAASPAPDEARRRKHAQLRKAEHILRACESGFADRARNRAA